MRRTTTYKVPHRRRREGRTDYRVRLGLLKSPQPRLVIRRSSSSISCQIVAHGAQGDATLLTATSWDLRKLGWKAHGGSIPAAYLTGYLCGTRARKKGIASAIADLGLQTSSKWSALYAALKGATDAGLAVPHGKDILPPADRAAGKHIAAYAEKLKKEDAAAYQRQFSAYLKQSLPPEQLPTHVEEIKKKMA